MTKKVEETNLGVLAALAQALENVFRFIKALTKILVQNTCLHSCF